MTAATKAGARRGHIAAGEVTRLEGVVQRREARLADAKRKLAAAKARAKGKPS